MKTFEVLYQAAGGGTGKTVQVDVYKPDKTKDTDQSGAADEVGTTGRYYFSFDADAPGWFVEISDNSGGKAVKHFGKSAWDAHGIAEAVADAQTAVAAANTALALLQETVTGVGDSVGAVGTDVAAVGAAVTAMQSTLATIDVKLDELEKPPMVG